jgi:hypothetical protein
MSGAEGERAQIAERERLLDEALEATFPASDPVALPREPPPGRDAG